ncbi:hypothetical protein BD560DRAFT_408071 [Blakeslea trispora]|nr:hypothetical protein BD560DRAFT_408071 [Blakeslea trispora]
MCKAYVDPLFWDVLSCSVQQPREEDEENIVVREVFEKLVKICQEKPLKKAKLDIVKERAKMMEEEREDTLKYNLVLICDFLLTNIGEWANTEAEVVERLSQMLRLLFMNTKLTVKTGEVGARCTKSSRTSHEASYSGGCSSSYYRGSTSSTPKNIYGRKVDLTIRGEKKIELALCEFKAFNNAAIIKKQEGKTIRLNHCVLEEMKEKNMSPKIMAFTWGGNVGEMFVLEEKDGLFVASSMMNNLIFPSDVRQINERFVNTMICFCSWRRHLVQLNEEAFVAYTTTATSSRKRKEYLTCLTPRHDSSKH